MKKENTKQKSLHSSFAYGLGKPLFWTVLITVCALTISLITAGCTRNKPAPDGNTDGVLLGVFHEGAQKDLAPVKDIEKKLDKDFASIMWYEDWSSPFPAKDVKRVHKAGYMPHITWEPWYFDDNQKVKLDDILAGKWDEYIQKWAEGAAEFGKPMFLRWGHEFNGDWYPWSLAQNGQNGDTYVAAYRKVHETFTKAGADNVLWIWCVNASSVPHQPWNVPMEAYPGDEHVDWVGIDGYNFSGSDSFKSIFAKRYAKLVEELSKPIMIAEFATGGEGKDKAQWITEMAADLKQYFPAVRAINWFDIDKERNWILLPDKKTVSAAKESFAPDYFQSDPRLFVPVTEAYPSRRDSYVEQIPDLLPPIVKQEASAVKLSGVSGLGQEWSSDKPVSIVSSGGEDDLSATIEYGWTKAAFHVRATIQDNVPAWNNKEGNEIWNGDCLEICLGLDEDADPEREFYTTHDFQLGLSPGSEKDNISPSIWGWGNLNDTPEGSEITVTKNENSYILEAMIPWKSLVDDFTPEQGMKLDFDFAIDDTDSSGDRESQYIWNGNSNFYSDPAQWGILILQ